MKISRTKAAPVAAPQDRPTPRPLEHAPRLVLDTVGGQPTSAELAAARATFDRAMALEQSDPLAGRVAASTGAAVFASYAPGATPPPDVQQALRAQHQLRAELIGRIEPPAADRPKSAPLSPHSARQTITALV